MLESTGLIFWLHLHLTKITSALLCNVVDDPGGLTVEAGLLEYLHLLLSLQPERVDAGEPVVREGEGEGEGGGEEGGPRL